ncbi:OmpA family protein [Oceaniglobus roseus]|uniref:OmpA family protein n=1 Tax=Oceaniglobus roseus TaxID=1737570 RepID=UPI000C7EA25F|nr:OmpA family protein [Kandeliimicrobium roseum]
MHRATFALVCGLTAFAALTPFAATAQSPEMTQEEIAKRFQQQKTRGLKIIQTTPQTGTDTTTAARPTGAEIGMTDLPPEQQVNINISFDFDSAALREDQKPKLTALCGAMKASGDESFRILGHTDASGTDEYNKRLSKLRAEEVKRFLVTDCGIAADRLVATGVGEEMLFDPANPRADVNRRVEFQIIS